MIRVIALVIDKVIDKLTKRKPRDVSLKNHRQMFVSDLDSSCLKAVDIIIELANARQSFRMLVADQIEIDGTTYYWERVYEAGLGVKTNFG